MLPQSPIVLLSYVNTKLRDEYSSLREFCLSENVEQAMLIARLAEIGYQYDEKLNRFR